MPWKLNIDDFYRIMAEKYGINEKVMIETKKYFSIVVDKKLTQGRSFYVLFFTSLYLAYRMMGVPRPIKDIACMANISPNRLRKTYNYLVKKIGLIVPPLDPKKLIDYYSKELNLSEAIIEKAISIIQNAQERGLVAGKAPLSIAASAIFLACQNTKEFSGKKQIASIFNISAPTIRNFIKKMEI
jgi:transcription initiation factor TFIIB